MNVQMDRRRKIANVTGDILGIELRKGLSLCLHRFFLLGSLSIFRFLFFTPTLLIYCLPVPLFQKVSESLRSTHQKVADKSMKLCGLLTFQVANM